MKRWLRSLSRRKWLAVGVVTSFGLTASCATVAPVTSKTWKSLATPESQGLIKEVGGKRIQVRYPFGGFGTENFEKWPTHAYDSPGWAPAKAAQMPAGIQGDPKKGAALFRDRTIGPCTGCHLIPDATVWPMGNVGPDLRTIGDRGLPDQHLYQVIYDPRVIFGPDSPMPPFGHSGKLTPEQIVHLVAYMQSLKGNPPGVPPKVTDDKQWDPYTRDVVRPDYGDPLDPTANPGLALTERVAVPLWSKPGPKGQSCASCHGPIGAPDAQRTLGVIQSMVGVATRYPKWFSQFRRMMSIEDFLAVHAPETTGHEMPSQGEANLTMAILVKMQSNGMPYRLDMGNPNVRAAIERGRALFYKKVGERAHACADCHTERGGAHKFLGGRFLANLEKDAMINHPYYRTAWHQLIDIRIRMQWCMTPLGTNMLPGDAPEYADLETFIISKQTQRGDRVMVPRLSH
jgi:sulfur-oxidizing protein SoxA